MNYGLLYLPVSFSVIIFSINDYLTQGSITLVREDLGSFLSPSCSLECLWLLSAFWANSVSEGKDSSQACVHPSFLHHRFNTLTLSLLSVMLTRHSLPLHQNSTLREHCERYMPTRKQGMTNTQIAHVCSCACSIAPHLRLHLQKTGSEVRLLQPSR